MFTYGKSRTEELAALSQQRAARARQEQDDAQTEKAEKMARQRALRLAKEAANKDLNG